MGIVAGGASSSAPARRVSTPWATSVVIISPSSSNCAAICAAR
jgi:hypothetical protein